MQAILPISLTLMLISGALCGVIQDCQYNSDHPMQNPTNCSNFYTCYNHDKLDYTCQTGFSFNPDTLQCDQPLTKGCIQSITADTTNHPSCPSDESSQFQANLDNCNNFYDCITGNRYEFSCPIGLNFNPNEIGCDTEVVGSCSVVDSANVFEGVPDPDLCAEDIISFQPSPDSCTGFYNCLGGNRYDYQCPAGYHFNPSIKGCDVPTEAGCAISTTEAATTTVAATTVTSHPDCETSEPGKPHADSVNCSMYYFCYLGNKLEFSCPEGYYFNMATFKCDIPESDGCNVATMCQGAMNHVRHPHESDCNKYYTCYNEEPLLTLCPDPLHFSAITNECESVDIANCDGDVTITTTTEDVTTTTVNALACPTEDEYVKQSHPTDCEKYYQCMGEFLLEGFCPSGLHFNAGRQLCDYPDLAGCIVVTTTSVFMY